MSEWRQACCDCGLVHRWRFKVKNGRIRQSIMGWCFNPMPTIELAKHCKDIGLVAMEGQQVLYVPPILTWVNERLSIRP